MCLSVNQTRTEMIQASFKGKKKVLVWKIVGQTTTGRYHAPFYGNRTLYPKDGLINSGRKPLKNGLTKHMTYNGICKGIHCYLTEVEARANAGGKTILPAIAETADFLGCDAAGSHAAFTKIQLVI